MTYTEAKERLNRAKEVSLIGLIRELGYTMEDTGSYYRMLSPFRSEGNSSFDINKKRPTHWRDRGNGKHGDVLDFVGDLFNFSRKESIDYLLKRSNIPLPEYAPVIRDRESIEIVRELPIISPCLIDYLAERKISLKTAQKWLVELEIKFPYGKTPDRITKVLGFKSDSGGYEMRSKFLKICNSPKNVTTIKGSSQDCINLYEGFFSFLSDYELNGDAILGSECVVLNSLSFLPQMISFWGRSRYIYSHLDNDNAGDIATKLLISSNMRFSDMRIIYEGYNDLNDFLCDKPQKKKGYLSEIITF